jgi:ribosome silencing factor RsfS/YbeB/iojap
LTSPDPRETALLCVRYALDRKAYDLLLMDVGECTSLADFFLICTGRSDTQVQAIAQSIEENLRTLGRKPRTVEGLRTGHWVLMDYGDVVVHIFLESARDFYDLERLWARAPLVTLPEPYRSQARDLQLAGAAR